MKPYQQDKVGERTSPEFIGELDILVPMGIVLIEFEECSDRNKRMQKNEKSCEMEVLEQWK